MKLAKTIVSVTIGFLSLFVMGDMAVSESRAANSVVQAPETITFYKSLEKKRKLTADESKIFNFFTVAHDVFKINDFIIEGSYGEKGKVKDLDIQSIANAIQNSLRNRNWDEPITSENLAKIKSVEEMIKTQLGADSYSMAWLTYKDGNKTDAKAKLNRGFDLAFNNAMKMDDMGFSDANPIQVGETFSKALTPLSTEAENSARADRLRKMRVRASNLPQIMT